MEITFTNEFGEGQAINVIAEKDTFSNKAPYDDEIAYQFGRTDNYMDYGNTKQFLYAWQCKKINPNFDFYSDKA